MPVKLLFDFNNVAMINAHVPQVRLKSSSPNMDFWAYLVFRQIYSFIIETAAAAMDTSDGRVDTFLVCDSTTGYWRRQIYPPYKQDRAERRESDGIDWPLVYSYINLFLEAVKETLPISVVQVPGCEADDVIAVICQSLEEGDTAVIYSSDCDYMQLISDKVAVYNPNSGFVNFPALVKVGTAKDMCQTPQEFLMKSILTGQGRKDNVYNVRTPTDWQPTASQTRRPSFGAKEAAKVVAGNLENFLQENKLLDCWERNKQLIDLSQIPENYVQEIKRVVDQSLENLSDVNVSAFLQRYDWPTMTSDLDAVSEMAELLSVTSGREIVDTSEIVESPVFSTDEDLEGFNITI